MTTANQEFQGGSALPPAAAHSVAQRLQTSLRESPYQELRRLECDCREGELTVRGRLASYYLKQLAVSLVMQVDGSVPIHIAIEVL